ncbi:MAG: HYR domain-containing protein, partial [Saprospiraceae bacterium]
MLGALFVGFEMGQAFAQPCTPNTVFTANDTICVGGSVTINAFGLSVTPTYAWQVSVNGGAWTAAAAPNNTEDYILPAAYTNSPGVYAFRRVVSRTSPVCSNTSSTVTITVAADPTAVSIAAMPAMPVCVGTPVMLDTVAVTGGSGNFTYDWEVSPNGINNWMNASGLQNEAQYSVPAIPGKFYYRQKLDDLGFGCADNIISNVLEVELNGPSPIFNITGGGNYCAGPGQSILLSGSKAGETYELLVETNQFPGFSYSGISKVGTGDTLTFDSLRLGGNYQIIAPGVVNGCSATMNGTVAITPDFTLDAQVAPAAAICGQEVTVVVRAVCTGADLIGMQFSVAWDPVSFEYVTGSEIVKTLPSPFVNNSSLGHMQYSWSTLSNSMDVKASDTLLTFKLKAISEDGSGDVALVDYMAGDLEALQEHFHILRIQTTPPMSVDLAEPNGNLTAAESHVCKGENNVALTFRATAGDPPFTLVINGVTYNNMADGSVITLTANANTTYNLTSVQDFNGCVNQGSPALSSVSVQVNEIPTVTIDPLGEYPIGATLTHTASISPPAPANGAYTYRWRACPNILCSSCSTSGFLPDSTDVDPTRRWTTLGGNSVSLQLSTPGCPDVTDCEEFNLTFAVTASVLGEDTICSGQNSFLLFEGTPDATVTYNANGGGAQNIQLDNTGKAILNTGPLAVTTRYALTTISIAATPPVSLPLSDTLRITVEPVPALNCVGLQAAVIPTNTGSCFASYSWNHATYNTTNTCIIVNLAYSAGLPAPLSAPSGGVFSSGAPAQEDFAIGQTIVTYTSTDLSGNNTSTCSFSITVTDQEAPAIFCPILGISVNANPNTCAAVANYSVTASDNCGFTLVRTAGLESGSSFPVGANVVQYAATDPAGQTTTCSFTVTVNDLQAPTITCPASVTLNNDAGVCSAIFSYSVPFSDNCPGATILKTQGLNSGAAFPVGASVVAYRATDASGLTAVCSFTVQVNDTEQPTISCPNPITVSNTTNLCTGVAAYTVTASDNCGATPTLLSGLASGENFPLGTTTNIFVATDAANNTVTCSFTVHVNDTQAPTITCPADFSVSTMPGGCTAVVNYPGIGGGDNCPGFSIGQTKGLSSGDIFPLGVTLMEYKGTDAVGNTQTCSFTVTVRDTMPPVFTACPPSATRSADPNQCVTVVNYIVTTTDNCAHTVTQTAGLPSGASFPIGATSVQYTAIDTSGNSTTCAFTITVNDTQFPIITCPQDLFVPADQGQCSTVVQFYGASATDNCPNLAVNQTGGPVSGATFPVGPTQVIYTAADASGNTAACSFTVLVFDSEAPAIACPQNVTLNNDPGLCSAAHVYTVTVSDNCPGATYIQNAGVVSGAAFPLGATVNSFVAADQAGNTAFCSFTVTVRDAEAPSVTCPGNIERNTDSDVCGAVVNFPGVQFADNCLGAIITQTGGFSSGALFPVGLTTNVYRVSDAAGNTATCSFTVTVTDNQFPIINCPANIAQGTDAGVCGATVFYMVTSADNCAQTLTQSAGLPAGALFPVGQTTNILLVTDASGNTKSCSFTVTVSDLEVPALICPSDVSINACDLSALPQISALPFSQTTQFISSMAFGAEGGQTSDNCGQIASISYADVLNGVCPAVVTRTFTVTDIASNATVCVQTLTVDDVTIPTIECPETLIICADPTTNKAFIEEIGPLSNGDNCDFNITYAITGNTSGAGNDDASGNTFNAGQSLVTYFATDACGNVGVCSFEVRVRRTPRPRFLPATENICNGQSIDLADFVDDQYNAAKRYDFYLGDPLHNGEFLGSVSATNGNPDPGQSLVVSPAGNNNGPTSYEYYVVGANIFNNGPNCLNVGGPFTVQVDPLPVGVGTPNLMTCSDVQLNIDLSAMIVNGATNVSFSWVAANNPRITGESLTPKAGAIINDILTNIWVLDTSVFYT